MGEVPLCNYCRGATSAVYALQRLAFYCRTTSASTAPCTSSRMCCPTHCDSYFAPCQPLLRAFSEWIRSPPPTYAVHVLYVQEKRGMRWSQSLSSNGPNPPLGQQRPNRHCAGVARTYMCSQGVVLALQVLYTLKVL